MCEKTERQIKRKGKEKLLDKNTVSVLMVQNGLQSIILVSQLCVRKLKADEVEKERETLR